MMTDHPPAGPIKAPEPVYLGDGVYAMYDGMGVWLHANDHLNPTDRVYLEEDVLAKLFKQYYYWTDGKDDPSKE